MYLIGYFLSSRGALWQKVLKFHFLGDKTLQQVERSSLGSCQKHLCCLPYAVINTPLVQWTYLFVTIIFSRLFLKSVLYFTLFRPLFGPF